MRFTALSAILGLLAVQQAAATGSDSDWQCSPGFPICSKSTNECSNPQKGGISCAEDSQPTSGSCSTVQGMGVQNANYGTMKRKSKRSLFPRNGGGYAGHEDQKCIKQTCGSTKGSGITINKGSGSQYSCNAHHIVVEQPTVVQVTHYNKDSDQTCSYHQMCNANEVTTINNDNCGQSDHHEIHVHPNSPSGPNVPIGVVGMNFNCVPAPPPKCSTPPVPTLPKTSTPVVVPSVPLSTAPSVTPSITPSAPSPSESGTTTPVVTPSSIPSPSVTPSSPSPSESGTTTPVITPSSTPSPSVTPSSPSPSESGTTTPVVTPSSTPSPSVTPSSPSPSESATTTPVVSPSSTPSPSVTPSSPSPVESTTTKVPVETETTSLTTYTTLTSCPVTSTTVVNGSTSVIVKTSLITSTITTCTFCVEKTASSTPVVPPVNTLPAPSSPVVPPSPAPTTTTPGSPQESGTTSSVPSPPVVYTSTPVVYTTTTEIVKTTLTTCPVTTTITPPHQPPTVVTTSTVSTVISTSTSTITSTTLSPPPSSPIPVVPVQSASSTPVVPVQSASSTPVVPVQLASSTPVVPVQSASSTPVSPPAQPSPPPAFKGCISAYFDLKGCGSNTDYDCYCKQDEVTTKVFECITNYEQDVAKQAAAMASYQGLCAQYVPEHPVIVTKSVQLIPTPVSTPAGSSPAVVVPPAGIVTPAPGSPVEAGQTTTTTAPIPGSPAPTPGPSNSGPSTTIPISVTMTVACPVAAGGLVNQITDGQVQVQATGAMAPSCSTTTVLSTQLAVPQMHFATSGTSVGLAAGTPAANEAGATGATPAVTPVPGVAGVAGASGGATAPSTPASTTTPAIFRGAAVRTSHSGVFLSVVLAAVGFVVYA